MFAAIKFPLTICVLCYGPHHALAQRCLESIGTKSNSAHFRLRIGLNAVSDRTRALAYGMADRFAGTVIHDSETNLHKLPMMRRLFHEPPIETEWTIWFDDDSYVRRADWLRSLAVAVETHPGIAMWGKTYVANIDQPMMDFVRSASWYRGAPFPPTDHPDEARLSFITGGWWAIRTECLLSLDWPDQRLIHFHDDFLLCEALRQNRYPYATFLPGVEVSSSERRAPPETPFGFVGIERSEPPI